MIRKCFNSKVSQYFHSILFFYLFGVWLMHHCYCFSFPKLSIKLTITWIYFENTYFHSLISYFPLWASNEMLLEFSKPDDAFWRIFECQCFIYFSFDKTVGKHTIHWFDVKLFWIGRLLRCPYTIHTLIFKISLLLSVYHCLLFVSFIVLSVHRKMKLSTQRTIDH